MAHDFFGSRNNNINLLKLNLGDNDISVNPITRFIFRKEDDNLLEYLIEDGKSVEPKWYIPIIPMVLVNGSEGGDEGILGWSSYVPSYNPKEIIANVKRLLNGENLVPMDPWYKGFRGTIEKSDNEGEYVVNGTVVEIDEETFRITELPIGMSIQDYKKFLESIADGSPNVKNPLIEDFRLNRDGAIVDIEIRMKPDKIALVMKEGLLKKFKLTTTISTSNMYLLDAKGKIKKFDTPEQIMEEFFFPLRLEYYEKRKAYILAKLERLLLILENKLRFISEVKDGKISIFDREDADLSMELKQKGFTPVPTEGKSAEPQVAGENDDNSEAQEDNKEEQEAGPQKEATRRDYQYLLSLPVGTFTNRSVKELLAEKDEKEKEFDILNATPATSLWMADLDELEKMLDEIDSKEAEEERKRSCQAGRAGSMKTQKDSADDDILSLLECLAAYNFESSSEKSGAMETEESDDDDSDDNVEEFSDFEEDED